MKIKDSDNSRKTINYFIELLLSKKVIIIILYSCLLLFIGAYIHKSRFIGSVIRPVLSINYRLPFNFTKAVFSNPEKIYIDIKFKDYQKLAYIRENSLKRGTIITTDDSYVPATLRIDSRIVNADIRLKGDMTDHIQGDKWSLRVKVKGENTIFGMKRFSIQDPKVAGYLNEWLLYKLYEYEGLIALRYDFVEVIINGKKMGLYALEESFSKELIEHNRRREGSILKFDESHLWDGSLWNSGSVKSEADIYFSSNIDNFRSKKAASDSSLVTYYLMGKKLLEDFRYGKIKPSAAFDIEQVAKLYAVSNLTSSTHALRWKNVRFYYNPITNKLELIGYNAYSDNPLRQINDILRENDYSVNRFFIPEYHNLFFKDTEFVNAYMQTLDRISDKAYLDGFFHSIENDLIKNISIIYRELPYFTFNKNIYYYNQRFIQGMMNPTIPVSAKIKIDNSLKTDSLDILVANTGFLPIEVTSVETIDNGVNLINKITTLPGKTAAKVLQFQKLTLNDHKKSISKEDLLKGLVVNYYISGLQRSNSALIDISNLDLYDEMNVSQTDEDLDTILKSVGFLDKNEKNKSITIKPGKWDISRDLVIPRGYKFLCGGNTELNLLNSARILSFSPVEFIGTEENPVKITSSDKTGQGIFVLNTKEKSVLNFVRFDNLSNPVKKGWALTGAVTFYKADVSIQNCTFSNNLRGDDYLNIVNSTFEMNNDRFINTNADAFDSDFCEGSIVNSFFENCGNDAIDISGTDLKIDNLTINNAGDKGLSSGENSRMSVNHVKIENSEIAVCSKDKSLLKSSNVSLVNNKIAFAAFQKKPEYGPGHIEIYELDMKKIEVPYLIETNSSLTIDGEIIQSDTEHVKDLLYGVKYGKSSD
ncbi:CotH kinase family protein [candidate division KSB1 bacterium]|nr:CotH kinase family protein [candidate division KSB1 bacterium]